MNKCGYSYRDGTTCGRDIYENSTCCILHSEDRDKDINTLKDAIKNKEDGDFSGIVFNVPFSKDLLPSKYFVEATPLNKGAIEIPLMFHDAHFYEGIELSFIEFKDRVEFTDCIIEGKAEFQGSAFNNDTIFRNIACNMSINFTGVYVGERFICEFDHDNELMQDCEVLFRNVRSSNPNRIQLRNVFLYKWAFLGTDVSTISFLLCMWPAIGGFGSGRMRCARAIYDEILQNWDYSPFGLPVKDENVCRNYEDVLQLYRGLRTNYERKLQYQEAGDFHIGEMEARRLLTMSDQEKALFVRYFEYIFFLSYRLLSGYGERYIRSLGYLFSVCLTCAFVYMHYGLIDVDTKDAINYSIGKALSYSFTVITLFLKDKQYKYNGDIGYFVFLIESTFGAIILPLLVISIRRRFKRSERERFYDL